VVTITGTNFVSISTVRFGTVAATAVAFVSATELIATSPVGSGLVDVTVVNGAAPFISATNANTKCIFIPAITGITPRTGPIGTTVTITGAGFTAGLGLTVTFGGVNAVITVNAANPNIITAVAPDAVGLAEVVVRFTITPPGGTPVTGASAPVEFQYITISHLSPLALPVDGSGSLTITGFGFEAGKGVTSVRVDGLPATDVTVLSGNSLTCTPPPGVPATPSTIVVSVNGVPSNPANLYYYDPAGAAAYITGVAPSLAAVQAAGGADLTVTLTGARFPVGTHLADTDRLSPGPASGGE
jgi:hypothetical protein